jgi:hypothetical protein
VCFDSGHCWEGYSNIGFIHSNIFWFQAVAFGSQDHIPFTAFLSFLFDSWISLVDHLWCFITKDMGSEITNKHALPVFSHSSPLVHCFRKKQLLWVSSRLFPHILGSTSFCSYRLAELYIYKYICI